MTLDVYIGTLIEMYTIMKYQDRVGLNGQLERALPNGDELHRRWLRMAVARIIYRIIYFIRLFLILFYSAL